ncbi:MAG: winged helix-turn-helix transcriptional regulator [Lachnospiraceae bacterium]|nr:winged helix-turn-helix transcriptional regulator [Lachnospiraceae bacterium]
MTNNYKPDNKLNTSQVKILDLLNENPNYTIKDLVKLSGFSDGYTRNILAFLKEHNYIRRVGSNRYGYWEIL